MIQGEECKIYFTVEASEAWKPSVTRPIVTQAVKAVFELQVRMTPMVWL